MVEDVQSNNSEALFEMMQARGLDANSVLTKVCGIWILVDRECEVKLKGFPWSVYYSKGAPIFQTRVKLNGKLKRINLPRFILEPPEDQLVARVSGTANWDFRKLAFVVGGQKMKTTSLGKRKIQTSSQYKGVSYSKKSKKWLASIRPDGLSISIGLYSSEIEAALAYNEAAIKYFGPSAFQNVIEAAPRVDEPAASTAMQRVLKSSGE